MLTLDMWLVCHFPSFLSSSNISLASTGSLGSVGSPVCLSSPLCPSPPPLPSPLYLPLFFTYVLPNRISHCSAVVAAVGCFPIPPRVIPDLEVPAERYQRNKKKERREEEEKEKEKKKSNEMYRLLLLLWQTY